MKHEKLEVLTVTMYQKDFSLVEKMNLRCDAVIANQSNTSDIQIKNCYGHVYKMITTDTIGVGKNRNVALLYATGDYLLFSDDDVVYKDDLEDNILKAFHMYKDADVIIFGISFTQNGEVYSTRCPKRGRLHIWKSFRYGTVVMAIKRSSLLKANLHFVELFGGGCVFSSGEDTDFILQCYKNKLKVYAYDYVIGSTAKDISTCFGGYNEKYFYDAGAFTKARFGLFAKPYMWYIANRTKGKSSLTRKEKLYYLMQGYMNYDHLLSYQEWRENENK